MTPCHMNRVSVFFPLWLVVWLDVGTLAKTYLYSFCLNMKRRRKWWEKVL